MSKLILPIIALLTLVTSTVKASPLESRVKPKLVVNIVVGQMRYDYLLRFADNLSYKGFRSLIKNGSSCDQANYNFLNTSTPSALATISSGSNPSTHGVTGTQWFNYTTSSRVELLKNQETHTVGADEYDSQLSPASLYAGTIADQIKSLSPYSKVVSIAFDPLSAVLMGGYRGDVAYWVNHREGHFVTNNYYKPGLANWVKSFNQEERAKAYCKKPWALSKSEGLYKNIYRSAGSMVDSTTSSSALRTLASRKWSYDDLKVSPYANTLISDFAIESIINEGLGQDDHTDLLNVVYDPSRYIGEKYGTQSIEVEDCFYKMDMEIATLIDYLSIHVGRESLLVVITSDHGASEPIIEGSKMPSGKFNAKQFSVLVNGFVGAKLGGDQRWVLDFIDNQVYLDRRLINQKGHDLEEIQNDVAAFAVQFSGVAQAFTATSLQQGHFSSGVMGQAQNSYFQRHSGDVILNLLPGWIVDDADKLSDSGTAYNYDTHVPLIFWGGMVTNQDVLRAVDLTDVASTIAYIVGCAAPNATTGSPIMEVYKQSTNRNTVDEESVD